MNQVPGGQAVLFDALLCEAFAERQVIFFNFLKIQIAVNILGRQVARPGRAILLRELLDHTAVRAVQLVNVRMRVVLALRIVGRLQLLCELLCIGQHDRVEHGGGHREVVRVTHERFDRGVLGVQQNPQIGAITTGRFDLHVHPELALDL